MRRSKEVDVIVARDSDIDIETNSDAVVIHIGGSRLILDIETAIDLAKHLTSEMAAYHRKIDMSWAIFHRDGKEGKK